MTRLSMVDSAKLREVCAKYGVVTLEVFGSNARDEARDDSDLDLLYSLAPNARLGWEIEDLSGELSQLFGRPVDLVSRRALHPSLRDKVLSEARPLYAA